MNSSSDELEETVNLLKISSNKKYDKTSLPPVEVRRFACKYPARFKYLAPKLNIDESFFHCNEFEDWKDSFEANGLSIIFASQYLENPASSFGHTFFKINSNKKALYLNKVISFAANVPEKISAPSYVWKGLTGGFEGTFSIYPFYMTFQEYANMERRDLWEYELELTQEQVENILRHLYELINGAKLDYTFLAKNCSGFLLRVVDTELNENLLDELPYYVMPLESIKVLTRKKLVKKITFHPSITSRLRDQSKKLTLSESKEILSFIQQRGNLSKDNSKEVLDLGIEYLNFLRQKNAGVLSVDDQAKFNKLLSARASKGQGEEKRQLIGEDVLEPTLSSGSQRLSVGVFKKENVFTTVSYRPVGKDFLDRPNGYLRESEINVLKTDVSINLSKASDNFFNVDIIGLKKYVDYDVINKNASWGINLAFKSNYLSSCYSCYFVELDSYYGYGKNVLDNKILIYSVFHPLIQYGNIKENYSLIPELELGGIYSSFEYVFKVSAFYGKNFVKKNEDDFINISSSFTKIFKNNVALSFIYNYLGIYSKNLIEAKVSYSY